MKNFTSYLKFALLTAVMAVCNNVFAGGNSSSSLTVNVAETDTGKGYVYVSSDRVKPESETDINEGNWWTTSSYPQNTLVDNDTHYYHVCGLATEGYKFVGIKQLLDENVYGDLVPADEEGFCEVTIECTGIANIAIYYAVFEEDVATAISNVTAQPASGITYNLQGQQAADKSKAILIRDGKKIVLQ